MRTKVYISLSIKDGLWYACCDFDDSPMYDATGSTPEEAIFNLAQTLGNALYKKSKTTEE